MKQLTPFAVAFALIAGCSKGDGTAPPLFNSVSLSPGFDVVAGAKSFGCYSMKLGGTIYDDVKGSVSGPEGVQFFSKANCEGSGAGTLSVELTTDVPEVAFYFGSTKPAENFTIEATGGTGNNAFDVSATFPLSGVSLDVTPSTPYGVGKCTKVAMRLLDSTGACVIPFQKKSLTVIASPAENIAFFEDAACTTKLGQPALDPGSAHDACETAVYIKPVEAGKISMTFELDDNSTSVVEIEP